MGYIKNEILARLVEESPLLHKEGLGREEWKNYALSGDVLKWIYDNLGGGSTTLETGCGYSTIVFALKSQRHLVVSPTESEHKRILEWMQENKVETSGIEFFPQYSQRALPEITGNNKLEKALDMMLIDGGHAFPSPSIDWYYLADTVKEGGYLVVDDTQLITGKILKDFLCMEKGRWKREKEIGKTAIFKRISQEPMAKGVHFRNQPYVALAYQTYLDRQDRRWLTKAKRWIKKGLKKYLRWEKSR